MADSSSSSRDSSIVSWTPNLIAFFGLIIGVFFSLDPLESPRPDFENLAVVKPDKSDEVYMRLWEDPLNYKAMPDILSLNVSDLEGKVPEGKRDLICLVSLPEVATSEAVEIRIRTRYAVITALLNAGYVELTPGIVKIDHINPRDLEFTSKVSSPSSTVAAESINPDERIVFETFRPKNLSSDCPHRYRRVTILFAPESLLFTEILALKLKKQDSHPVLRLQSIFKNLADVLPAQAPTKDWAYIGPQTSQDFITLAGDVLQTSGPTESLRMDKEGTNGILWLSPSATVANKCAWYNLDQEDEDGDAFKAFLLDRLYPPDNFRIPDALPHPSAIRLIRTSCGDDQLAASLLRELHLRGLPLNPSKSAGNAAVTPVIAKRIVLITEADTIYGTAFPITFKEESRKVTMQRM